MAETVGHVTMNGYGNNCCAVSQCGTEVQVPTCRLQNNYCVATQCGHVRISWQKQLCMLTMKGYGNNYCVLSQCGLVMNETVMHLIAESCTVGQYHRVLLQYHWWNCTNYTICIKTIYKKHFQFASQYKSESVERCGKEQSLSG